MNKPEDDPQTVVTIADNLFASGSFEDYAAALIEARARLKQARSVIDRDKDPKKAELKDLCAKGRPKYEVRTIGNGEVGTGVFMDVDYLFQEQTFIDELVKGLMQDKRSDRRKDFAIKWWAALRRVSPEAPDIADSRTWTLKTLLAWKEAFGKIYQNERKEVNTANLRPRKRERTPVKIKKAQKDI